MRISIALLMVAGVAVSGCGGWRDSGVNPRNWFGNSKEVTASTENPEDVNPLLPVKAEESIFARKDAPDESVLIVSVSALKIERTSTGAIVYATGLADRQGAYNVHLRPDIDAPEGTLSFQFKADYPSYATHQGTELTRTVRAAFSLTTGELEGIKLIRVTGAQNAQETRRR